MSGCTFARPYIWIDGAKEMRKLHVEMCRKRNESAQAKCAKAESCSCVNCDDSEKLSCEFAMKRTLNVKVEMWFRVLFAITANVARSNPHSGNAKRLSARHEKCCVRNRLESKLHVERRLNVR